MTAPTLDAIAAKLAGGTPLERADYLALSATTDLVQLGMLASDARRRRMGDDVTYVVSGGGCKTTSVGHSDFTTVAASTLQFLSVEVEGDRLVADSIRPDGSIVDTFELRAREGR